MIIKKRKKYYFIIILLDNFLNKYNAFIKSLALLIIWKTNTDHL